MWGLVYKLTSSCRHGEYIMGNKVGISEFIGIENLPFPICHSPIILPLFLWMAPGHGRIIFLFVIAFSPMFGEKSGTALPKSGLYYVASIDPAENSGGGADFYVVVAAGDEVDGPLENGQRLQS